MDELLVDKRGAVTLMTLNRPDAHNSITAAMAAGLAEGIDAFAAEGESIAADIKPDFSKGY